jgi:hypothetical protein
MCWFKKRKDGAAFTDTAKFLQERAAQIGSFSDYVVENEAICREINSVKEAYIFAVAPRLYSKEIEQCKAEIEKMCAELKAIFRSREWDEKDVMFRLADLKVELRHLTSINKK